MRVRIVAVLMCLSMMPTPALARWLKKPCTKGPDGRCVKVPCDPFLAEIRSLATYRQKADDPRCPAHEQSSRMADLHQVIVDREQEKMSTRCIRQASEIMRAVASIDVRRSYANPAGDAVAVVRYANHTKRTVHSATIACSAIRDTAPVAVGEGVVAGPIPAGSSRDLQVTIALAGGSFSCVQCELVVER